MALSNKPDILLKRDLEVLAISGQRLKAVANEDTLLPTQMFPRLPARATFVAETMFPSLRSPRNIMGNNGNNDNS